MERGWGAARGCRGGGGSCRGFRERLGGGGLQGRQDGEVMLTQRVLKQLYGSRKTVGMQSFWVIRLAPGLPVCLGRCALILIHGILGIVDHSGALQQPDRPGVLLCVGFLVSLGPVSSSKHQANFLENMPVFEGGGQVTPWEVC